MKVLKVLIIIVVILAAVFFVVPFFLADSFVISETTEIKARPETVFRQVNSYKNWSNWSPFEADTTMVSTYEGPDRGVGSKRIWDGEKAGKGSITIMKSDPYSYIQNKLEFGPDEGGGIGSWNFEKTDDGVNATWTIHIQDLQYPFGKWMGVLVEMNMGPIMAQGLKDLKSFSESLPVPTEVKVIDFAMQPSVVIRDSATIDQAHAMFEKNYGELMRLVNRRKIPITGEHFAIYHNWNPQGYTQISAGIPIGKKTKDYKRINYYELPATKAVFAKHEGGYNTGSTHYAIDDFIKDHNLETKGYIWETYAYDPITEPDSAKWVTLIYYPLK